MNQQSTPVGFSLYDLLTRIIPGLVIIAPFAIAYILRFSPNIKEYMSAILLFLAILTIIAGEIINSLRSHLFRVPPNFRWMIYVETNNEEALTWFDKKEIWLRNIIPLMSTYEHEKYHIFSNLEWDFQEQFENEFKLSLEESSPRDIFDALLFKMGTGFTNRTRRHYTLFILAQNLKLAFGGVILFGVYQITIKYPNIITPTAAGIVLVLIFVIPASLYLTHADDLFLESLFKEYYFRENAK